MLIVGRKVLLLLSAIATAVCETIPRYGVCNNFFSCANDTHVVLCVQIIGGSLLPIGKAHECPPDLYCDITNDQGCQPREFSPNEDTLIGDPYSSHIEDDVGIGNRKAVMPSQRRDYGREDEEESATHYWLRKSFDPRTTTVHVGTFPLNISHYFFTERGLYPDVPDDNKMFKLDNEFHNEVATANINSFASNLMSDIMEDTKLIQSEIDNKFNLISENIQSGFKNLGHHTTKRSVSDFTANPTWNEIEDQGVDKHDFDNTEEEIENSQEESPRPTTTSEYIDTVEETSMHMSTEETSSSSESGYTSEDETDNIMADSLNNLRRLGKKQPESKPNVPSGSPQACAVQNPSANAFSPPDSSSRSTDVRLPMQTRHHPTTKKKRTATIDTSTVDTFSDAPLEKSTDHTPSARGRVIQRRVPTESNPELFDGVPAEKALQRKLDRISAKRSRDAATYPNDQNITPSKKESASNTRKLTVDQQTQKAIDMGSKFKSIPTVREAGLPVNSTVTRRKENKLLQTLVTSRPKTASTTSTELTKDQSSMSLFDAVQTNKGTEPLVGTADQTVTEVVDNSQCKTFGIFPDPKDCTKYYVCRRNTFGGYRRQHIKCPLDFEFSSEFSYCTYPTLARCESHGLKPGVGQEGSPTSTKPAPTNNPNEFECTGRGNFPDPLECSKYYVCLKDLARGGFIKYHRPCPSTFEFSPSLRVCTFANVTQCNSTKKALGKRTGVTPKGVIPVKSKVSPTPMEFADSSAFQCQSRGEFPDPDDCTRYYACEKDKTNMKLVKASRKCPKRFVFDPFRSKCTYSPDGECANPTGSKNTLETLKQKNEKAKDLLPENAIENIGNVPDTDFECAEAGNFPDLSDCTKYYVCVKMLRGDDFHKFERSCPPQLEFDILTKSCSSEGYSQCNRHGKVVREAISPTKPATTTKESTVLATEKHLPSEEPANDDFVCTESGNFPDSSSCSHYYFCFWNYTKSTFVKMRLPCFVDREFDPEKKRCVWKQESTCS